jgi:ubiquinone/menaquinone biosynthesis C-methylase UbiE
MHQLNPEDEQQMTAMLKETFNTVSNGYDHNALRFFPKSAEHFASCFQLRGDERVLDVATGTGHLACAMAKRLPRGHVTAIDFSSGMLDRARKNAAAANIRNVDFIEMDMQAMGLEPAAFDIAICAFGIFFVADMDRQLAHIAEMVREGGVAAICSFEENYMQPLRDMMTGRLSTFGVPKPPSHGNALRLKTDAGNCSKKRGFGISGWIKRIWDTSWKARRSGGK